MKFQKNLQNGAIFEQNTKQTGNVLRILNARTENNGVYICLATNSAGSDQAATVIEVEGKLLKKLEIFKFIIKFVELHASDKMKGNF